jgi:hypothetical protein
MKPRMIGIRRVVNRFIPDAPGHMVSPREPIVMSFDELEALRLVDYLGLTQEEASERMRVSRGTVWRCLDSARRKLVSMLVEGRELVIR